MKHRTPLLVCSKWAVLSLSLLMISSCTRTQHQSGIQPRVLDPSETSLSSGIGIESQDLVSVTDKMARSILNTPEIANAANPPIIALYPVENNTHMRIDAGIFTDRIKALLNSKCRGKVRFTSRDIEAAARGNDQMTRVMMREKSLKDEGIISGGPKRKLAGEDFVLTGKLSSIGTTSARGASNYVLYTFKLVDAETLLEVWEDFSEIKKEGLDDAIYR